jgi:DUF4097 and DUF4098 domain-containing protein YvlB
MYNLNLLTIGKTMNRSLSLTAKISILIVLALVFGAAMISLSIRRGESRDLEPMTYWGKGDQNLERTFTVQPNGDLIVDADEGEIHVTGSDSDVVTVQVTMRGDKDRLERYKVAFNQEGNTVRIEGREGRKHFRMWQNGSLSVRYEIQVPKKFNLDLQTAGGDLVVRTVEGTVTGTTSGGNLDVSEVNGRVKLETSGGDIDIRNSQGDLSFNTSGGSIDGETIDGELSVVTSGGNITFRKIDAKLRAETSGGNIDVTLLENKGIYLETSGGNVKIRLPHTIAAEVEASSSGGDVDCALQFAGKIKDGDMNGTINGGGKLIRATTSGGNIYIVSAE